MFKNSCLLFFLGIGLSLSAQAADEFKLIIKNHRFEPEIVKVPSGKKIHLMIENQDKAPEEFESYDLNREKIIPGGSKAVVRIGPLKPGSYGFIGEFNSKTAHGKIIAE